MLREYVAHVNQMNCSESKKLQKVADYLKDKRKALGLTQSQFGAEIGVTRQTIGKWESGEDMIPSIAHMIRIDGFLEDPTDRLVPIKASELEKLKMKAKVYDDLNKVPK